MSPAERSFADGHMGRQVLGALGPSPAGGRCHRGSVRLFAGWPAGEGVRQAGNARARSGFVREEFSGSLHVRWEPNSLPWSLVRGPNGDLSRIAICTVAAAVRDCSFTDTRLSTDEGRHQSRAGVPALVGGTAFAPGVPRQDARAGNRRGLSEARLAVSERMVVARRDAIRSHPDCRRRR